MPDEIRSDLSNKVESINDMLVKFWLIEDDNWKIINELKEAQISGEINTREDAIKFISKFNH